MEKTQVTTPRQRETPRGFGKWGLTMEPNAGVYDFRTVQELLGHKDVRTTMIYTHVINSGGRGVRSPADGLARNHDEC